MRREQRGDEGAELVQTVRAIELDRPPLPQLSPGAWQMKERGIEVGRVGAWHEAKARAAEVIAAAERIAGREAGMAKDLLAGRPVTEVMGRDYEFMLRPEAA